MVLVFFPIIWSSTFALLCVTMGLGKVSQSLVGSFPSAFFYFQILSFIYKLISSEQDVWTWSAS